jgi:hypothetical protein
MPRTRPTPLQLQTITAYVRAGGFLHIAAEAAGVPSSLFDEWMRRGGSARARPVYREFFLAVTQAAAQARLGAEVAALKDKPLDWLKYGPGKETKDRPGWTTTVKPFPAGDDTAVDLLLHTQVQALITRLLELLAAYPEARAGVAEGLVNHAPAPDGRGSSIACGSPTTSSSGAQV